MRLPLILLLLLTVILFAVPVMALEKCPTADVQTWTNCKGTNTNTYGNEYIGEWKDGKYHGNGTLIYANGGRYEGEWKSGKRHGHGSRDFSNSAYVGEWKNDKFNGHGSFISHNNILHVGEWKDSERHGTGTLTDADGRVIKEGVWKNGIFQNAQKIFPTETTKKSSLKENKDTKPGQIDPQERLDRNSRVPSVRIK
jgi:hypothetical protein